MQVTTKNLNRVDLVSVSGRIDANTAPALEQEIRNLIDAKRFRIVVDLTGVDYISSAGLKVLLNALKEVKRWNRGDLRLVGLQPKIREIFDMVGLLPLFKVFATPVDGVGSF